MIVTPFKPPNGVYKVSRINLGVAESGEHVYIDIPMLVTTRILVTASSGGGKSETLRRILEEAVGHIQCIVIDPEGEFSTLREKKPFVLIGEGGEAAADIRTAALVATRLLELNASAVCDIYEMPVAQRHEWVKRFLDALVHAPKALWHPVLVIVDEAHTYCPEAGYGKSVASQSVIDLCNLGRKRGFCAILATQRLSKLDKNAVEPLQNYLLGLTMFDDQKRACETFKVPGGAPTREFSLELERLKSGQFIARGRAITGDMLRVQVLRGETRPPKTGAAMAGVVTPTPEAVKALLPKLADLPQEVEKKAKTEDDLRREASEAKRRVAELERQLKQQAQQSNAEEVRMLQETLAQLKTEADEMEQQLDAYQKRIKKAAEIAKTLSDTLSEPELEKVVRAFVAPLPRRAPPAPQLNGAKPAPASVIAHSGDLTGPEQRILGALAQLTSAGLCPCVRLQVAMFSDYSNPASKGFSNGISSLSSRGLICYPSTGLIDLTPDGRKLVTIDRTPLSNEDLQGKILDMLDGPCARILHATIKRFPRPISRDDLGHESGYSNTASKGFSNSVSRLSSLGLIEYPERGQVRAHSMLFPQD